MLVYDETSTTAAVQWMGVVQQHLRNVPMTDYLSGLLTSTCKASARLIQWKQKVLAAVVKQMPDAQDAVASCASDASLLFFLLLREQLARLSAEPIVNKSLEHIRKKYVVPFLNNLPCNEALLQVALHIAAACQATAFTWPAAVLDNVMGTTDGYLLWQACEVARVCLASPHTLAPDGASLVAPLRVLSTVTDLQHQVLLYKAWHQSSQSLWSALVNVRESPDSLRMTLPHSARAPMHPTSLPMLAQFLQCMRTTAHDVAVGCVQGVLDMVSAQEGQVTFPADLRTPGTLLHATRHVLDWVLDEYMDVLFCQGIEMLVGAVVHACVRAHNGNIRYSVILGALPSLLRQHGVVDAQGQVDEKAAKRLRVSAKEYYSTVFLEATSEGLNDMIERGELYPQQKACPHKDTASNMEGTKRTLLGVADSPAGSAHKATQTHQPNKRGLVPRDTSSNQRALREFAAHNVLGRR